MKHHLMYNQILHLRIHSAEVGHDLWKVVGILTALDIDAEHNSPIYGPTESFSL